MSFAEHAREELQAKALESLCMLAREVPEAKDNALGALFQLQTKANSQVCFLLLVFQKTFPHFPHTTSYATHTSSK